MIEDTSLRDKLRVFKDRTDAGRKLASCMRRVIEGGETVLAIPSGGVPVASEIADEFSLPFDLIIVGKIQIPWNPEAGFGAVDPDGIEIFNDGLLRRLMLSEAGVRAQVEKTLSVISKRNEVFRNKKPMPELAGKGVIIVDDGLASGYTMCAAINYAKRKNALRIIVAVPTALERTVNFILPRADEVVCLNVRGGYTFAVADAYRNWYDLTDEEVLSIIEKYNKRRRA